MSDEWILANEASQRDWSSVPAKIGASIIEFAAHGLLRTRAAFFVHGGASPAKDVELPAAFWQALQSRTGGAYRDWAAGSFRTAIPHSVTGRVAPDAQIALGVAFRSVDLDAYFPASRSPWFKPTNKKRTGEMVSTPAAPRIVDRRPGGAPPKVEEWHRFYLHAMRMLNDGDLSDMTNQAELRRALLAAVGDALSEDTVRRHVAKIWHVFREGLPIDPER